MSRWFLRSLGFVYLTAFLSFGLQARGLIGSHGIQSTAAWLDAVHEHYGATSYYLVPSVFWLSASDTALVAAAWIGAALSILLMIGIAWRIWAALLFCLYLSITVSGRIFWGYQWDALLVETGFLAIFLGLSPLTIWLFRWLLFRLMFESGAVKVLSHDPAWSSLTALQFHWETQPLPTPLAWYVHLLPDAIQKACVAGVFAIELIVPFFLFAPRRWRIAAAALIAFFQILIFLTGNYTFFNLLTIALCLFAFDSRESAKPSGRAVVAVVASLILTVSAGHLWSMLAGQPPSVVRNIERAVQPFEIVNSYGLFAVMTTTRPEVMVEGSDDAVTWKEYPFAYQPQRLDCAPRWVAPYQPRLDWQMWFAALSDYQSNPWFAGFLERLLEGSPDVLGLLAANPFPDHPPRYVRAPLYEYHFTDWATRRRTGQWWTREWKALYAPVVSLTRPQHDQ